MITKDELHNDLCGLAVDRQSLSELQNQKAALLAKFMASPEFASLIVLEKYLKDEVQQAEDKLRADAVDLYKVDPSSKEIIPGVNIRETTKIDYDPTIAKSYAMKHLMFLKLDEKAFEKYAKDQKETDAELDFVTISKVPSATISTDLSKFLPESAK